MYPIIDPLPLELFSDLPMRLNIARESSQWVSFSHEHGIFFVQWALRPLPCLQETSYVRRYVIPRVHGTLFSLYGKVKGKESVIDFGNHRFVRHGTCNSLHISHYGEVICW